MLEPARRAQLVTAGRIGGLTTAARHDMADRASAGQRRFRAAFILGHECAVCPLTIIPVNLPEDERRRRSQALFHAHMVRIRNKRAA